MTHTFRLLTCIVAMALVSAFGCTEKTPEKDVKPEPEAIDTVVEPKPTETAVEAPSEGPVAPKVLVPKLLEIREMKFSNADESKVVCSVKYFSDDTTLNHGPYALYYSSGEKWQEGRYEDGKKLGEWTTWYQDGTVAKIGNYKDDLPDGQFTYWRPDGNKEREENYQGRQRHGRWIYYTPSGDPKKQEEYQFGKKDGTWIDWYSKKVKLGERNYREGILHGTQTNWSKDGTLRAQFEMRDGKRHGTTIMWDQNGDKISELHYKNDSLVTEDESND